MINGYNVGKDISVDIVTQLGQFNFSTKVSFDARQAVARRSVMGLDGINRHLEIPQGWSGTIEVDRADNSIDAFFASVEALYYSGAPIMASTMTVTISNPDLSVSQYLFTGVVLSLPDGGRWRGDDIVRMRIDWVASQRTEIA